MSETPPKPFKSDGCSMWPDGTWRECCVEHDRAYWMGGTVAERKQADVLLKKCVSAKGSSAMGFLMYAGVRAGGVPWLPTPWRWGFGWPWPRKLTY